MFRRLIALSFFFTALSIGCGNQELGNVRGVDFVPSLTLESTHLIPSAVDLRITEKGMDSLLGSMIPQILGEGETNPDGTTTIDLSDLPEDLLSSPLEFGPFQSGITLREVKISIDLSKLEFTALPSSGPIRLRLEAYDLPVRIDHAIISGEVALFGIESSAACRLETEAPEMSTFMDLDAILIITSLPDQTFETDLELELIDIKEFNLTVEQDCTLPECTDQVAFESPCIECGICDNSLLSPDLLNGLRDLLGDAFQQLLTILIQPLVDTMMGDELNQALQDLGLNLQLGPLLGMIAPALEPLATPWRTLELKSRPSLSGFSSTVGDLKLGLDVGFRSPEDGRGSNRSDAAAIGTLAQIEWPDETPTGKEYDLGLRLRPEVFERLLLSIFKTGLACTTIRPQDIQALSDQKLNLTQESLQLLFPELMGVGAPDLPVRFQLNLAEDELSPVRFDATSTQPGVVDIDLAVAGLEIIVTADGPRGPSWLTLAPQIKAKGTLSINAETAEISIQLNGLELSGLEGATTPITNTSNTKELLNNIGAFTNDISFEIPLTLTLEKLVEGFLSDSQILDINATTDGRLELYLGLSPQTLASNTGTGALLNLNQRNLPPQAIIFLILIALVFIFIKKIPKAVATAGLTFSVLGLVFASGCEPRSLKSSCSNDTDCGAGYLCNDEGLCVPGTSCELNGDCCAGYICIQGLCSKGPDCSNTGCPIPGTECVEGTCLAKSCLSSEECPVNAPCNGGFCSYLVCPEDEVLDRAAAYCINAPKACKDLNCPAGSIPEILDGPHSGLNCSKANLSCSCVDAQEIDGPSPSGDLAMSTSGYILWYDARYGDLVQSQPQSDLVNLDDLVSKNPSEIIEGLPSNPIASGSTSSWRAGVIENGPDIGRSVSSIAWSNDLQLVAALDELEKSIILSAINISANTTERVLEYPGLTLAGPILHEGPEQQACLSYVQADANQTRRLRVLCSQTPGQAGSFTEKLTITLSPTSLDATSCNENNCEEGSRCVRTSEVSVSCMTTETDCDEPCDGGSICTANNLCRPLVFPQDLLPATAHDALSVSSSEGQNIFVTTTLSPNEVVAIRWSGAQDYTMKPLVTLPAAGGRGLLSSASLQKNQNTTILLSIDQWPNLHRYEWPDNAESPAPWTDAVLDLPGGPRNRIRELRAGPIFEGAPTWLARVQPDDRLLWFSTTTDGGFIIRSLEENPVLGITDLMDSEVWGWRIDSTTGATQLHKWTLSQ